MCGDHTYTSIQDSQPDMPKKFYPCGNSCRFGKPDGPSVNGPCTCLSELPEPIRWKVVAALQALTAERETSKRLAEALVKVIYEITHLSPQREDGGHKVIIGKDVLNDLRNSLAQYTDQLKGE